MDTLINHIHILSQFNQYFYINKYNIKLLIHKYGQINLIHAIITLFNIHKIPYPYTHYFNDDLLNFLFKPSTAFLRLI